MSLLEFLNGETPTRRSMSLMHCTPVLQGVRALDQGALRVRPCSNYGDRPMVYLFYGRPAFKPMPGMLPARMEEHLPMCLVLDAGLIGRAVRIVPFDSGGFARYQPMVGPLARDRFELHPSPDLPRRIVGAFFETNANYFHQMPTREEIDISLLHPEARAIVRLSRDPALADDDDRRTTIEIQLEEDVVIESALKAIIGPPLLFDEPVVARALAASGAVPLSYETFGRQSPSFYASQLYVQAKGLLRKRGML
ncbi:hypothetical protein KV697_13790 [Sphingomonas sanguinis]|uniref:hypothetical protein n=1 Tax=Sphingomonas sanguinis TaxID=33051 RepID=UPI001C5919B6|nr:hypothetical protein [Sphingomonas sanguinis]QXT34847.1 hypothetical protein KV697_13790 [Sphingomonas sanguinis]